MFAPRFTVRWLLAAMVGSGIVFFFGYLALRGHAWATGLFAACVTAATMLGVLSLIFLLPWLLGLIRPRQSNEVHRTTSDR